MSDGFIFDQVITAMDAKQRGAEWLATCPCHDDSRPSLAIKDDRGTARFVCRAGCDSKALAGEVGKRVKARFNGHAGLPSISGIKLGTVVATYEYADETGKPLFEVQRFEPKTFRPRHRDERGNWVQNLADVRRVLYRLPQLIAAVSGGYPVHIVEGEKDCATLEALGMDATTCPGGAGKWRSEYASYFKGAIVHILPDNDEPGRAHAETVARALSGIARLVKVIALPGLPPKGDVTDWFNAKHSEEEFITCVNATPEWKPRALKPQGTLEPSGEPSPETTAGTPWQPPEVVTYGAGFDPAKIPLRRWLLGYRYSIGELTVDVGPPGVNKSTLMLSDAVQIATGRKILNDTAHATGGVLFLVGEDRRRDFEVRLAGILTRYKIGPAELEGRLHVVYRSEVRGGYTLADMDRDLGQVNADMFHWLRTYPDIVCVMIDPLAAWHRLIEKSNEAMGLLSANLRALADQSGRAVVYDHHVTKISMVDCEAHVDNPAAVRGAGSIVGDARWIFTMARIKAETAALYGISADDRKRFRRLDGLKASYRADDDAVRLLYVESVPIANGEEAGVLTEVDTERLKLDGQERKKATEQASRDLLIEALTAMLVEEDGRSARDAAEWISKRHAALYTDTKGKALTARTIRTHLEADIGAGLPTKIGHRAGWIVYEGAKVKGKPDLIRLDFGRAVP